jgi:hypothetical protein
MNADTQHPLDKEIAAYNLMKPELNQSSSGKWVVFYDCALQGTYEDFDSAAADAIRRFGRGPYLIRQVGEGEIVLPASVVYAVSYNAN